MLTDVFLYFYHLSAWYWIDIVRRNCLGHSLELNSYRLLILIRFKAKGKLSTVADQKKNYKVKLSNSILSPDYNQPLYRKFLLSDRTICKLWQKYHQFWLVEGSIHILDHYLELMLHIREKWGGGGKILNLEFPSISMAPIDELTCFESLSLITPLPHQF